MAIDIIISLLVISFICAILLKTKTGPFLLLLGYTQAAGLVSSLVVESGFYVTEIGQLTFPTGATRWYALALFLLFLLIWLFSELSIKALFPVKSTNLSKQTSETRIYLAGIIFILSILYLNIIFSGSPLFNQNINRFNFWEVYSKLPYIKELFGELSLPLIIILGILTAKKKYITGGKIPKLYWTLIASYFCYLLLLGHKFNGFIVAASFYSIPFLAWRMARGESIFRIRDIAYALGGVSAMLYMSFLFFSKSTGGVIDIVGGNAIYGVFYRAFVLQGYSWWSFFEVYKNSGVIVKDSSASYMEYGLNLVTANPDFFLKNGIDIANIFPGVILASSGWPGLLSSILVIGISVALLAALSRHFLLSGSTIRSAISLQLLFWLIGSIPSYRIEVIYSGKFIVFLCALAFISYLKKTSIFKKRKTFNI